MGLRLQGTGLRTGRTLEFRTSGLSFFFFLDGLGEVRVVGVFIRALESRGLRVQGLGFRI